MLEGFRSLLADESAAYTWLMELHEGSLATIAKEREKTNWDSLTPTELLQEAMQAVDRCVAVLHRWGFETHSMDAGHGMGHIVRDYTMALILAPSMECSNVARFAVVLAGTFHDIGCALQGRYEDGERAVRHAEAGAYLMQLVFTEAGIDPLVSELAVLGIVGHTHYPRPMKVVCKDGVEREVKPFVDLHPDGSPVMSIWGPRWVDRCDLNGPTFIGRHVLTLTNVRKDFDGDGFYAIDPAEHFRPIMRTADEIKAAGGARTMLEHIELYRGSQSNASLYGKFDSPFMQSIRDERASCLSHIMAAVLTGDAPHDIEATLVRFESFLATNIEPDPDLGRPAARKIMAAFRELPEHTKERWAAGFEATMAEYHVYHEQMIELLAGSKISQGPSDEFRILGYSVLSVLTPHRSWSAR
ncbi:hypothetical protein KBC55_00395 [Patescibacteria group bacterium]|nr:hypothetical protein [Patescibacteria group bacterium]